MIPDYVLTLYENEIRKIVKRVLSRVSDEYKICNQELESKVSDIISLKLVSEDFETVTITKKNCKQPVPEEDRCIARLKRNGLFSQCKRNHKGSETFLCPLHSKRLPLGTINDIPHHEVTYRSRKNLH